MRRTFPGGIRQLVASYAYEVVSPVKVIDTALQIANESSYMNSLNRVTAEIALAQANESSFRYRKKCQRAGTLDGIPITIKDNFCTMDVPTTCSSKMLKDFVPTYNATVVERLFDAGAVMIGKANMDEFAMGSGTVESIFGPTKNVWSKSFEGDEWNISGGSSGGSANSVATGICFASIGSDTGGSIRLPAAYCGIVGLKPTYGLVSRHGLIPLANSMDVPGICAKTVDDCAIVLNVISGPDCNDSTTLRDALPKVELPLPDELNVKNIRVGIPKEYHCEGMCPEVLETWMKVADMLEDNGACVTEISLPHAIDGIYVYSVLNQCEVASNMARYDGVQFGHRATDVQSNKSTEELYAKSRSEGFNTVVKTRILAGNFFLLKRNYEKYFVQAMKVRRLIKDSLTDAFKNIDVILAPTTLTEAPLYKEFIKSSNRDQCAINDVFTTTVNLAGIPAISLPIRLSSNGLPLALQLMGDMFTENRLMRVAKWIESRVDFQEASRNSNQQISEICLNALLAKPN